MPEQRNEILTGIMRRLVEGLEENPATGCWEWKRAKSKAGYGRIRWKRFLLLPHRVTAVYFDILDEYVSPLDVMHTCDNPSCCNPDHLRAGTRAENMQDCVSKGRHLGLANLTANKAVTASMTAKASRQTRLARHLTS